MRFQGPRPRRVLLMGPQGDSEHPARPAGAPGPGGSHLPPEIFTMTPGEPQGPHSEKRSQERLNNFLRLT